MRFTELFKNIFGNNQKESANAVENIEPVSPSEIELLKPELAVLAWHNFLKRIANQVDSGDVPLTRVDFSEVRRILIKELRTYLASPPPENKNIRLSLISRIPELKISDEEREKAFQKEIKQNIDELKQFLIGELHPKKSRIFLEGRLRVNKEMDELEALELLRMEEGAMDCLNWINSHLENINNLIKSEYAATKIPIHEKLAEEIAVISIKSTEVKIRYQTYVDSSNTELKRRHELKRILPGIRQLQEQIDALEKKLKL